MKKQAVTSSEGRIMNSRMSVDLGSATNVFLEVRSPLPPPPPPTVLALLLGLVSPRWVLITACCVAAHVVPFVLEMGEEGAGTRPDAASVLFVMAVASMLADLCLYPRYYRPPPPPLLLILEVIVSVVASRWVVWAAWQPLKSLTHTLARAVAHRCALATAPRGWGSPPRLPADNAWAVACDAAAPLPAAAYCADALLLLAALGANAAVLHATELLPRLSDYFEDWSAARRYEASERHHRPQRQDSSPLAPTS